MSEVDLIVLFEMAQKSFEAFDGEGYWERYINIDDYKRIPREIRVNWYNRERMMYHPFWNEVR